MVHGGRNIDDIMTAVLCARSGALVGEVAFPSIDCTNREVINTARWRLAASFFSAAGYGDEGERAARACFLGLVGITEEIEVVRRNCER
uniref:Uncharacterized protein n=1 Tax=Oryza punctata TaxID=4537 RepID=A0A0E0KZV0_ORYPU